MTKQKRWPCTGRVALSGLGFLQIPAQPLSLNLDLPHERSNDQAADIRAVGSFELTSTKKLRFDRQPVPVVSFPSRQPMQDHATKASLLAKAACHRRSSNNYSPADSADRLHQADVGDCAHRSA
eukprot:6207926-Pleurochrysis_carterae.AAC.3